MDNLKEILQVNNFKFKKKFGQNFISDKNLLSAIAEDAQITRNDTVVEIGCGGGTLTCELAKRAGKVIGYEIDLDLKPVLENKLRDYDNVELRFTDIQKDGAALLDKELDNYIIVANLPYYITTPLIMNFTEKSEKIKRMVVMVQQEVAQRLTAHAGCAQYGSITVAVNARAEVSVTRKVPRKMFYPVPNVDSCVVRIDFKGNKFNVEDYTLFRSIVRSGFSNRRKTLVNNLICSFGISREIAQRAVICAVGDAMARGETLSADKYALLSRELKNYLKQ